jgi:branched-chain amino acid transport system substrate-binding protein
MKRRAFIGIAVGAAAAGAVAPAAAQVIHPVAPLPVPGQFLQQLSIGVNVTLSGDLQKYGAEIVKGVQAAVDETNRFTAPVRNVWGMRAFDDRNDPATAAANAGVAAADPSVVGIVGNLTAAMTLAALSQYANASFAVAVPTVTADAVTRRGYRNVYRLPAKDSTAGALFAQSVLDDVKGVASVAVAFDGDYGYDVARGFVDKARADRQTAELLLFPQDKTLPAEAARTVLDRNPGYVFLAGKTADMGPVAAALRLAGYTGRFGASDGFYDLATISTYGKVLDGALVASPMPPLERIPTAVQYLNDFEHEVAQITAFSAFGYAAAQLLIAAAQRANTTTRFGLLREMQAGGSYTTLVGQYSFDVNGDPRIPDVYLYRVSEKGFSYVRPAIRTGFVI